MMIAFYFLSLQNLDYFFQKKTKMTKFFIVIYIIRTFKKMMNSQLDWGLVRNRIIVDNLGGNINKSFFRIWIDEVLDNCYCNFEDHIFESGNFI